MSTNKLYRLLELLLRLSEANFIDKKDRDAIAWLRMKVCDEIDKREVR